MQIGIDAINFSLPKLHLAIDNLAVNRLIESEKLTKGLGLQKMAILDFHQDVITMAANSVFKLIKENQINLDDLSRIYVGSESGVDSSKPIGSYIISLLESKFGEGKLSHCDVVDMTFACIGGVDALQNCLDYIRLNPKEKAIVVTTDIAKYDLESSGEYTQGAGSIAMLITVNPRIISFDKKFGVSTQGVFDFFKPRISIKKEGITGNSNNENWFDILENEITLYKEQPVFDGQYSNACYISRIVEAYQRFTEKTEKTYNNWHSILMHLPYCFQGRRTFIEIIAQENPDEIEKISGENFREKTKNYSKSETYKVFVQDKIYPSEIASSQIGNIYTGSIFLGFLSTLSFYLDKENSIIGEKFGFIAYGSGSKSKVFEGEIQKDWKNALKNINLFETLEKSVGIDFDTYLKIHKKEINSSVLKPSQEFVLSKIEKENPLLKGARYYEYVE